MSSFYPGVRRDHLIELIRPHCDAGLSEIVERIFGRYAVETSAGLTANEASKLAVRGLPQGAVHSGFWSNVYLAGFDQWVKQHLVTAVGKQLKGFRLKFYARYVDDMRIVGCYQTTAGAPRRNAKSHPLHREIDKNLQTLSLRLSAKKSLLIQQNAGGTLLTTGQVAERMQTLKERLYMPLPPEELDEASKDLRLLFHAEVPLPKDGKGLNKPHLDNPGVRPDSRRRFAAGKWVHVAKELERLLPNWTKDNGGFPTELVRSWLEQPEQVQLLYHALRIGIAERDAAAIRSKIHELESDSAAYGYFAYLAAFFLEQASRRGGDALQLDRLPLGKWAKAAVRNRRKHPVLLNKARQYLVTKTRPTENDTRFFLRGVSDGFCGLLRSAREGINWPVADHPAEIASQLATHGFTEEIRLALVEKILEQSETEMADGFLRQVLLTHTRQDELAGILRVARKLKRVIPEFAVFRPLPSASPTVGSEPLYRSILRGTFRSPLQWCKLAEQVADFLLRLDAVKLGARGLLHPFSLVRAPDGTLSLAQKIPPNLAFAGYAARFGSLTKSDSSRAWCLPVGLLLHAAATTDHRSLLGFSSAQRFRTLSAMQPLLASGGLLPESAGEILMRLFTWPGSRIEPFASVAAFRASIEELHAKLQAQSSSGMTVCDVGGASSTAAGQPFSVVLCQIPSHPASVSDVTIRRALGMARIIGREQRGDNRPPRLVVFPELSVPVASLPTLKRFVRATGAMVLAGLELRSDARNRQQLNELVWIVPSGDEDTRPVVLRQQKIHITDAELRLSPPIRPANPAVIWRIGAQPERLTAINCYEFTDLTLRELLRGRVEALIIAANNRDVPTFDNLVESTHYDLFCHVLLVNAGAFGGSAVRAPYREPYHRRIFDIHGGDLFAVNLCELDLAVFRQASAANPTQPPDAATPRPIKTRPAGFRVH